MARLRPARSRYGAGGLPAQQHRQLGDVHPHPVNCADPWRAKMRHNARAAVTASLMFVAIAGAAVAGPIEDGEAAWDRKDYATALRLFRSLAEQRDATAQEHLGVMYENGQGVPQDYAEAVLWYHRAANQGLKTAQWNLGVMYQTGYGAQQDYVQAHMWYNLSAAQGWGPAAENRTMLEKAMTPAQVAEAQKLAREWKPKPER
jgi:uncharacterized protein